MAHFEQQSSTQWPHPTVTILVAVALFLPHSARAEIILDDFDEPLEIKLPEMMNRPYIVQSDIGPLGAERWSDVVAFSSRPTGLVDANVSRQSSLNVAIDHVKPTMDGFSPVIGLNFLYYIPETDITQGGANDRVVVDFAYLRSAIPLRRITVFVRDESQGGISFGRELFDIPVQDEPFSLEFPLDSFRSRGGGAGRINYQRVYRMSLHISPARFDNIDQITFATAVERIRITRAVPEPTTSGLICGAIVTAVWFSARKRSWSHEDRRYYSTDSRGISSGIA